MEHFFSIVHSCIIAVSSCNLASSKLFPVLSCDYFEDVLSCKNVFMHREPNSDNSDTSDSDFEPEKEVLSVCISFVLIMY